MMLNVVVVIKILYTFPSSRAIKMLNTVKLYVASGNKIYQYNIPAIFEDKAKAPVQTVKQIN